MWIGFTNLFWDESRYVAGKESWTDADKDKHPFDGDKNDLTHSKARYDRMIEQYRQTDHEKYGWPSPKLGGPSLKWAKEACRAGSLSRSEPIINAIFLVISLPVLIDHQVVPCVALSQFICFFVEPMHVFVSVRPTFFECHISTFAPEEVCEADPHARPSGHDRLMHR